MPNQLIRHLLGELAQSLAKSATVIETYLNKDQLAGQKTRTHVSHLSNDTPPEHWLEKVRQGAPHLLDQMSIESKTESFSYRTHQSNEPPNLEKQNSESNKKTLLKLLDPKKSVKVLYSVIKPIIQSRQSIKNSPTKLEKQPNPSPHNKSTATLFNPVKPKPNVSTPDIENPHFQKLETIGISIKKSNLQNPTEVSQNKNNTQNKPVTKIRATAKTKNNSDQSESPQKRVNLSEHIHLKTTPTLHLYPRSKTQSKVPELTSANRLNKSEVNKHKSVFSTEFSNLETTLFAQQPEKIQQKNDAVSTNNRGNKAPLPVSFNSTKKIDSAKQTRGLVPTKISRSKTSSFMSTKSKYQTDNIQESTIHGSSRSNTQKLQSNQDRWPELPKQQELKSGQNINQSFNFWQIQEQAKSDKLRDQEQRGLLWNG